MEIFLIRHGEMEYEETSGMDLDLVNDYATGTREGPLTPEGVHQARLVAKYLADRRPHALYSSAFIRTRQTAAESSETLGLPVTVFKDLGEINVGRLDPKLDHGQKKTLLAMTSLHRFLPYILGNKATKSALGYWFIVYYFRKWYTGKTVGGEPVEHALTRVRSSLANLTGRHDPSEQAAVFTHGFFIHLLVNHVIDPRGAPVRTLKNPTIRNGSITSLTRSLDGSWKVNTYAATTHLH